MLRCASAALASLVLWGIAGSPALGDAFDQIEGEALAGVPRSKEATPHQSLTIGAIDALPNVLPDSRSPLLIATTDAGNLARLLVVPALRKPPGGQGAPFPVLQLERFDTFEAGNVTTRLARGKDLLLFDGFQLDLDSGQVVPEGQGGDLQYLVKGPGGPRLVALGKARLYSLTKAPAVAAIAAGRPSIGRSVVPGDFTGRYRLFANGQWSGTLDLKADADGNVSGRFRSDLHGTTYPVTGKVAADIPQKVAFTVRYPRARQDFEGMLWTEGKGAMAGTLTMEDRAYGFFAVREGGRFAPEGEDIGPLAKGLDRPGRRTVVLRKGQYTLDGKPKTDQELADALKKAVAAEPEAWVLLQIPTDESFAAVNQAFEAIAAAGVASIRLAPADPGP